MDTENITDKIVAVTGGAGFIGSHLCDKLLASEPKEIIIIDDLSLGKMRNIEHLLKNPRVKMYKLDASDYQRMSHIFKKEHIDVVFNLAVVPLPRSLETPKEAIDKNTLITTTMCELLLQKLYQTLIHCSSSEAYGTAVYVPMDENHPLNPLTPYAASKIACDHIVLSYHRTFNVDVAIARPFNAYGPCQNESSYAAVVPITIRRILTGKPPIIYGDGTINIATGKEIRIKDLINLIAKLADYKGEIVYADPRPGDVRRHKGDISLAKKLLDYSPKTDWETDLRKTIDWYKEQLAKKRNYT